MSRRKRYTRNLGRKLPEPSPSTLEWVRFEHHSEPYGLFSYLRDARKTLSGRQVAQLERLVDWFNLHLEGPPAHLELDRERFWFRAEAMEFVGRARRLAELVGRASISIVERRTTQLPGFVQWQDAHQLAVLVRE